MPSASAHIGTSRRTLARLLWIVATLLIVSGAGLVAPVPAHAYASDLGDGAVHHPTYRWSFPATSGARATSGAYDYLVYTPSGWTPDDRLPLYLVLHGCPAVEGQGAEAMMQATRLNALADKERFVVLYAANGARCWRASSPGRSNTVRGGGGDADVVAGMTRQTMSAYSVDSERVYILGFSSGGSQASATGYAYPDLYAAVGTDAASGPNMDITCNAMNDAMARSFAESTVQQMGIRARAVPFFAIGGDGLLGGQEDPVGWVDSTGQVPKVSGCTRIAYLTALAVDELMTPGATFTTSYSKTGQITHAEDGTPVTGVPWKRQVALDPHGCAIAENWIAGTGHKWMGGSTDPDYAHWGINDFLAPSTGENSWAFFKQFTLHGGNTACHPSTSAEPSPTHGGRPRHYRASASATLIEAERIQVPGQEGALHLDVAPVTATVDSTPHGAAPKAVVDARSMTVDGLGAGLDQTYGVEARQSAPPSSTAAVRQQAAAVPAAPYFNADLATADAHARWGSTTDCITDGPIATAKSTLLNAQVQPDGQDDGGSGWHGSTAGMDDYVSPPGTGTSTGLIELTPRESDDRYSLSATASTQVAGINVSDALYVEVVSPAKAEVVATGVPGTAAVAVNQPVLRVQGATLASGRTFTTRIDGGQLVEITPGFVTKKVSRDGTTASASGILAHVEVLDPTGAATVADLTIGSIAASAIVPEGGVSCRESGRPTGEAAATAPAPAGTKPGPGRAVAALVGQGPGRATQQLVSSVAAASRPRTEVAALAILGLALLGVVRSPRPRRRAR
jgi:poly(3-hydroxybutyrate) depolymerase